MALYDFDWNSSEEIKGKNYAKHFPPLMGDIESTLSVFHYFLWNNRVCHLCINTPEKPVHGLLERYPVDIPAHKF